ncbi:cubilin-like isoform X2 [Rhopilema esculentum]|uniref:cubilin-like isoform X2 n=1 Tax=Rhopilema esculentum TaxID=499914 RepID=UPI0031D744FF
MGTWKQLLNCWQTIPRMALFEILLAIAMFTGKSETATCEQKIVADLPSLSKIREFGKIYSIEMPSSSPFSNGTCSWEFSSPENYLLNLYFINITSPQKSSGSDCSGNYFLIKSSDSGRSTLDVSQQFCWQRALPRLRVNGTVTVELHYNQNTVKGAGLSMAVSVEASSPGCGGVFNDSSNYVPASFDSQTFGNGSTNSPIHCVWYFHFMAPQEMNILVSHFDFPHDFNPECTSIRKFIELRSFNESTGMTIQRSRKCARSNYALPENFKIQTSKSFVVTVHSEGASSTRERILTACLPTSPGASREYFSVDDIQNQTLHELTRASNPKENVRGLILLKPERSADQLFTFINNISRICSEGKLQIWSTKANIFKLDTQICSSALSGSTFLNSNVTIAINYEARQEAIEETEVSFFASNKGCGGLFEFKIGDSKIIKSPHYGRNYPANSDCRWMLLRDNGTELEIIINEMYLETCSDCSSCDYIKIYKGITTLKTWKHTICQNFNTPYIINGNVVLHFHSDSGRENRGFAINVTAFRACGGRFSLSPGQSLEILSPRYEYGSYPANSLCQWEVTTTRDSLPLNVSTVMMDLGCYGDFHYDYVEIFKNNGQNVTLMYTLCEKLNKNIMINGSITVRFHSDSDTTVLTSGTGFKILINALPDPVKMTTRLPSTTATTSVSTTLRTSKNTTSIQTTNCCSTVDKKTTQTQSKNRKSTKASQLFSTIQTKKSVSAKAKKSVASNENLYIATITVGAVIMLCMGFLILAILRRRKRSHQTEKENSDQVERSKKRKRQNSAMPLVSMDDARKTSLANNALDGIIENIAYAEMNIPSKEMENPYYRASDHRHAKINPCYASGTIEEEAEYATANEQHIYSDVLSKTSPDGYSYAQNPATTKTDVSQDSGSKEGDENPYESTDYGYVI